MELMALGHVEYKHHTGHEHEKEWAGRYVLVRKGGKLKFKYAGIIIVSIHGCERVERSTLTGIGSDKAGGCVRVCARR